jgi:hypothetical protein
MTLTTRMSLLTLAIVASAPTSPTVAARQHGGRGRGDRPPPGLEQR